MSRNETAQIQPRAQETAESESSSPIYIWRNANTLEIEPYLPQVARVLFGRRHSLSTGSGTQTKLSPRVLPFFARKRESLRCRAAMEPVVRRVLGQIGRPVEEIRGEFWTDPIPPPEMTRLGGFSPIDRGLIDLVHDHRHALIRYQAPDVDPARLIAQIASAWPRLHIVVAVTRKREAKTLAALLRKMGCGVSVMAGSKTPATVKRLVVSTYAHLATAATYENEDGTGYDNNWFDIVIALDAVEAIAPSAAECLTHVPRARIYGLVPTDTKPAPFERDALRWMFGFQEVVIRRHGYRERRIEVEWTGISKGPFLPQQLDPLQLKRSGLWQNGIRNRLIAKLARRLRSKYQQKSDSQPRPSIFGIGKRTDGGVVVLVENVEHGLALASFLPGWGLATGPFPYSAGLSEQETRLLRDATRFAGENPPCMICTFPAAAMAIPPDVDVLIRADGGSGLPPIPESALIEPSDWPDHPIRVYDFRDNRHSMLRRWSKARERAYRANEWHPRGTDPVEVRVDEYLSERREALEAWLKSRSSTAGQAG